MNVRHFLMNMAIVLFSQCIVGAAEPSLPWSLSFAPAQPRRVHVVRGLWTREYRLNESLALGGGAVVSESYHGMGNAGAGFIGPWTADQGGSIHGFPDTWPQLLSQHLVIVVNVDGKSFPAARQQMLHDFVKAGGSLLLLGGRNAFGMQYHGTLLEQMTPVTFTATGFDLRHEPGGLVVAPATSPLAKPLTALNWSEQPRVYWYHAVQPKPDSHVVLQADGHPLLVLGEFGRGRVAVFAGSVMGDSDQTTLPCWKWADWAHVLAHATRWLLEPIDAAPRGFSPASVAQLKSAVAQFAANQKADQLDKLLDIDGAGAAIAPPAATPIAPTDWSERLLPAAPYIHNAASAKTFLETVVTPKLDVTPELLDLARAPLRAHIGASFAPLVQTLIDSGHPYKTVLGLALLGRSKTANAEQTLMEFYERPQARPVTAGMGKSAKSVVDLNPDLKAQQELAARQALLIRTAVAASLGDCGTPAARSALIRIVAESRPAGQYRANDYPQFITHEQQLHQQAITALLRCGNESAAVEVVDALLKNRYVVARLWVGDGKAKEASPDLGLMNLAACIAWQEELLEQLNSAPAGVLPVLAGALAAQTERRTEEIALAAFAGRKVSPAVAKILAQSRLPAIAALARQPSD